MSFSVVLLILLSTTCLLVLIPLADGFSGGAGDGSCVTMIPLHTGTNNQPGPTPYAISLSRTSVKGTESVDITMSSSGTTAFKGFFIQVRKAGGTSTNAVGNFDDSGSGGLAKVMDCPNMPPDSSVTHTSNLAKNSVTVRWVSPNEDDEYEVYFTGVADVATYWAKFIHTEKIKVTKDPSIVAPPPPPSTPPHDALLAKWRDTYSGCGKTKGCFGMPSGCVTNYDRNSKSPKTCEILVTWRKNNNKENEFELTGRANKPKGYVAVGFSADSLMGEDSVVGCTISDPNSSPMMERYFNERDIRDNVKFSQDPQLGLKGLSSALIEQNLFCKFTQSDHTISGFSVNFAKKYAVMLSRGPVETRGLGQHPTTQDRAVSKAISVTDYSNAESEKDILVQLHGSLLLFAWLPFSSCSIFIARYFKQTHVDSLVLGRPFWLTLHVSLMVVTAFLTLSGIGIMIYEKGGVDLTPTHSLLGLCVVALAIPQMIFPLFRNAPWSPRKVVFSWCHFSLARLIQVVACACIFLAVDLDKAGLKQEDDSTTWWMWVGLIVATILFQIGMHAAMMYHTYWADHALEVEPEFRYRAFRIGPLGINGVFGEAPGTRFRYLMLIVDAAVLTTFSVLLSLLVFHQIP